MSSIYINKTYIYSKRNIAGFELRDKYDKYFRKLLRYDEAIEYIKSLGGKIENAEVFVKNKDDLGKNIYEIKANGENLSNLLDRKIIFNLNALYNEREKYYEEYKELFLKFIYILNL